MDRRSFLAAGAAVVATRAAAAEARSPGALFVSHGSPLFLPGQAARRAELSSWARELGKPAGVVVMTPHFGLRTLSLGAVGPGFAWYDLPGRLKRQLPQDLEYRSPDNHQLVEIVRSLLGARLPLAAERRGFDHTTWMPLLCLLPAADVPVIELCYPYVSEAELFALGQKLAPLAEQGVRFLASGGLTHNLALDFEAPTPGFMNEFDDWASQRVLARDIDALCDWRHRAPAATLAHPDDGGHFRVILAALGVAGARGSVSSPVQGFAGALSKRCFELG